MSVLRGERGHGGDGEQPGDVHTGSENGASIDSGPVGRIAPVKVPT